MVSRLHPLPLGTTPLIIEFISDYVNDYEAALCKRLASPIFCPICSGICHLHGCYSRTVLADERRVLSFQRVWCMKCKVTHAIIPNFLTPYGRYPTAAREAVVTDHANGVPLEESGASHGQTVETSKRWIMNFKRNISSMLGAIRSLLSRQHHYHFDDEDSSLHALTSLCRLWLNKQSPGFSLIPGSVFGWANLILSQAGERMWL
jgi:hypothetical protein